MIFISVFKIINYMSRPTMGPNQPPKGSGGWAVRA